MDKQFLCLDSPTDFMVGKYISADELKEFINIPCKIKAGVVYPLSWKGKYAQLSICQN